MPVGPNSRMSDLQSLRPREAPEQVGPDATQTADAKLIDRLKNHDDAGVKAALAEERDAYMGQYGADVEAKWEDHVQWAISTAGLPDGDASKTAALSAVDTMIHTDYAHDPMQEPPIAPEDANAGVHWNQTPTRVDLYPSGKPEAADINQKSMGNCYLDASLAGLADVNPQKIQDAITQTGTGDPPTYDVKMFDPSGQPITISVNGRTLYNKDGSSYNQSSADGMPTWGTIMEKAYAKYNSIYQVSGNKDDSTGGFGDTGQGGWIEASKALTGVDMRNAAPTKEAVIQAVANNDYTLLSSPKESTTSNGKKIVGGHAYTLIDYNAATNEVTVRNPWGTSDPNGDKSGLVTMPMDDFLKSFDLMGRAPSSEVATKMTTSSQISAKSG